MSEETGNKPPKLFFWIGGIALVWNLIGVGFYVLQVTATPEAMAQLTDAQQEFFANRPAWATSAFAIAVNAGAIGSLLLILRKALAVPVLIISFAGVLVQDLHAIVLSNGMEAFGTDGLVQAAPVILIGAFLIWYALQSKEKGWLS